MHPAVPQNKTPVITLPLCFHVLLTKQFTFSTYVELTFMHKLYAEDSLLPLTFRQTMLPLSYQMAQETRHVSD